MSPSFFLNMLIMCMAYFAGRTYPHWSSFVLIMIAFMLGVMLVDDTKTESELDHDPVKTRDITNDVPSDK